MPELSRFYGLIVKMIYLDSEQHHKPHVHVYYGDYEAYAAWNNAVAGREFSKIEPLS